MSQIRQRIIDDQDMVEYYPAQATQRLARFAPTCLNDLMLPPLSGAESTLRFDAERLAFHPA